VYNYNEFYTRNHWKELEFNTQIKPVLDMFNHVGFDKFDLGKYYRGKPEALMVDGPLKNNIFTVVDFLKQKFNYENEEIKQVLVRSMKIFNFSNEELEERFEEIKMTYSIGDNSLKLIL